MKRAATLTVTVVEQDGWIDKLVNRRLTETQKELVRLAAKEAVGEYIRELQYKLPQNETKAIKSTVPDTGFVRLPQVLELIPVGPTCWWECVRTGRFPKPVKLSARCTAWRVEDIRNLIKSLRGMAVFMVAILYVT